MSLLIRNALVDGIASDILIEGAIIKSVGPARTDGGATRAANDAAADSSGAVASVGEPGSARRADPEVLDASGMAALPSFVNAHTHAAMTLFRGIAEDMELMPWLTEAIWPREARLTPDDVYWGTRLAALEMIRSGTTLAADMYFFPEAQARAARDSGMRFVISYPIIDGLDESRARELQRACTIFFETPPDCGPVSTFGLAAHSVYATSASSLRYLADMAAERGLSLHIHLAETETEDRDCRAATGKSPVAYLDSLGALGPRTFAAHCVHLSKTDWDILAARRVCVVHNPVSNMKLACGGAFDYHAASRRGIRVLLGTDGAASNNSLNLAADMKIAGLLQKHHFRDPRRWPVAELFNAATRAGHEFFNTGAGRIEAGATADLILVDTRSPEMTPIHDLAANLVYAGATSAIDTTICAGKLLMRHRVIEGEEEVRAQAALRAHALARSL